MTEPVGPAAVPTIAVDRLEVRFGGVIAVENVTFTATSHELVGIIGPNGAGKTTMMDAICGFVPHRGRVLVDGRDISGLAPQARAWAGLGRSFQDARLFPALTVRETLTLALQRRLSDPGTVAQVTGWPTARLQERELGRQVTEALDLFGLGDLADKFISELSTGTRRIVELAGVYVQRPRVILLDEPSAGIAQREVEALTDVILRLRKMSGATVLVVEHDIPAVRKMADRLVVLEYGQLIADGAVDEVLDLPAVIAGYLGTNQRAIVRSGKMAKGSLVQVATEETEVAPLALPPGLPARDDFKVRLPQLGVAALAGLLALALTAFTAGPLPGAPRPVARTTPNANVIPGTTPPSPSPSPSPAPAPPLAALPPALVVPPAYGPPPPAPVPPAASPSPTGSPSPSASPSPTPCTIPGVVPLPTPLPTCPPVP